MLNISNDTSHPYTPHFYTKKGGNKEVLPIYDITPFTMLDFPNKCAAIIWFSGCNMRCGYCHNPQIVKGKGTLNIRNVLNFLGKRKGLLDGVVISGGEATIYPELPKLMHDIKSMGYAIKLDTNGTRPDTISYFLDNNLLDYIALDYKAPPNIFKSITGIDKFKDFEKTLNLLCNQTKISFEIRTTVHTDLMNEKDIKSIINDLNQRGYKGTYYIQNYINNGNPTLKILPPQSRELNLNDLPTNLCFKIEPRNFN